MGEEKLTNLFSFLIKKNCNIRFSRYKKEKNRPRERKKKTID